MSDIDDIIKMGTEISEKRRKLNPIVRSKRTNRDDTNIRAGNGSDSAERGTGTAAGNSEPVRNSSTAGNNRSAVINNNRANKSSDFIIVSNNGDDNCRGGNTDDSGKSSGIISTGASKRGAIDATSEIGISENVDIPASPLDIEITSDDKPKRGRGRPAGANSTSKSTKNNTPLSNDVVSSLTSAIFGMAVLLRGEHWAIDDNQANAIASPLTKILARQEKLNPKAFERMEEILEYAELGINLAAICGPALSVEMSKLNVNKSVNKKTVSVENGRVRADSFNTETEVNYSSNGTGKNRATNWGNFNRF